MMRRVLMVALLLVAGVMGSAQVRAQETSESHLAAARRAIGATRSTDRFDNILLQMGQQAKSELIRNSPDKEAEISAIVDEATLTLATRRGDLEGEAVQVFANVFSEDELTAIADFYESDAGKKFLEQTPLVLRELDRAARVWANGVRRDLQGAVVEKMKAAGLQ
ncbi:MAG: DUF2059 domain-containing protein [Nitratireductor sp.]|nr:DUF2059 domain-containing protein [Nitratireductor sp.]